MFPIRLLDAQHRGAVVIAHAKGRFGLRSHHRQAHQRTQLVEVVAPLSAAKLSLRSLDVSVEDRPTKGGAAARVPCAPVDDGADLVVLDQVVTDGALRARTADQLRALGDLENLGVGPRLGRATGCAERPDEEASGPQGAAATPSRSTSLSRFTPSSRSGGCG